jgi:hypothetical protein
MANAASARLICALAGLIMFAAAATPAFAAESEGKSGAAGGSASPYFAVEPIPVSIIRGNTGRGILVVEVGIDAGPLEEKTKAEHALPLLRDLYIQVLNLYASRDLHLGEPPDAAVIKHRLQEATDNILGKGKAKVLLRQVLARRI